MNKLVIYLIALISGEIGVFAFSPFDYWGLAYVSLGGLLFVAKNTKNQPHFGHLFVVDGLFCFGVSWLNVSIHQFGGASLGVSYLLVGLLSVYLALYPMLFTYLVQRFQVQSAVIFAAIWTLTEFLRGWVFTGFPRYNLDTPNRQSVLRYRADLWCHRDDILLPFGQVRSFFNLIFALIEKTMEFSRRKCVAIIGRGWIKRLCR